MTGVSNISVSRAIVVKVLLGDVLSDAILAEKVGIIVCGRVEPSAMVPARTLEAELLRGF